MINRSFFNAALFLTLLSPIPYGEVLAAESLELRNLPTTRPSPADEPLGRSDSPVVHPALPVPTAPSGGTVTVPSSSRTAPPPLPSVPVPQERIIILEDRKSVV